MAKGTSNGNCPTTGLNQSQASIVVVLVFLEEEALSAES